jgi:hypothetical protein
MTATIEADGVHWIKGSREAADFLKKLFAFHEENRTIG